MLASTKASTAWKSSSVITWFQRGMMVLDIGNMRVRFHQRRVFQASQDGDYRHHAARIDGKTDDGTAHLVPDDLAGAMEQLVEQEVELFMLGMSQPRQK